MASTVSPARRPFRRSALGAAAAGLVLPLALAACSGGAGGSPGKDPAGPPGAADRTVRVEVDLNRSYGVPSLAAFARLARVDNVISGTVTATRPLVTPPADHVETVLTISVERQRKKGAPATAEVREQGGVVTVEQVRSSYEGKLGRELTAAELAETVAYRVNGVVPARVGDRVLVVVADDASVRKPGAYVVLARLVRADATGAGAASAPFTWPGEPPNPAWEREVDGEALLR
ncbi:hypothetical protein ACWD4X_27280 [Streptomyces termitum]